MLDTNTASLKLIEYMCKKRDKQPHCVVCDSVLFNHEDYIFEILRDWEYKKKWITNEMVHDIMIYFHNHYPYYDDPRYCGHHTNYEEDIKVPVCSSCHPKIHNRSEPEFSKWKPVDKRPPYKSKKNPEVIV